MPSTRALKKPIGMMPMVAVMGVDGSGKSTLVERIESKLIPYGIKGVLVLSRINTSSQPSDVILNHDKPPRPLIISIAKIAVKVIEWYWQYYKFSNLRPKGYLIILDRFYFLDVLVDPLKYRYSGPLWIVNTVAKKVPKPNLYILLDAPEHVVLSRKQEVQVEEISRQRNAFLNLFRTLPNGYIIDASNSIDKVVEDVVEIISKNISY